MCVRLKREAHFAYLLLSFIDMCPRDDEVREMNSQATDSHNILTLKMHVRNDGYVLSYHVLLSSFEFEGGGGGGGGGGGKQAKQKQKLNT